MKWPEGSIYYGVFLKELQRVKSEVTGTKKPRFWLIYLEKVHKSTFLGPVTSILTFLRFSQGCAWLCRPFRSFRLLWNFFSSNFWSSFFSSLVEKLSVSAIYKSIWILVFSVGLPVISVCRFCGGEVWSNYRESFEDGIWVGFGRERRGCWVWTLFLCLSMFRSPGYFEVWGFWFRAGFWIPGRLNWKLWNFLKFLFCF